MKVARTVATGGMEKRAVGTALCPYPLGKYPLDQHPEPHGHPRQNFRYVFGSLSRPYRLIVTPQNCRCCLFHIESLILPLYGPEGSSS